MERIANQMFEIRFFPIYGVAAGVNYWDTYMDYDLEDFKEDGESVHILQILLFLFGVSVIWYKSLE